MTRINKELKKIKSVPVQKRPNSGLCYYLIDLANISKFALMDIDQQ